MTNLKQTLILFLVFLLPLGIIAQEVNDSIVRIDTSSVIIPRTLNNDLSEKYSGEEFKYSIKTGESQNLLSRFINWIGRGLKNIFGIDLSPQVVQFLEYLVYLLLFVLAIYILVKVFTNESFSSLFNKKAKNLNTVTLTDEHIEAIDLNTLLNSALTDHDFRLAIRYQFLLTLQKLSIKDIIDWHFEKTNSDYLTEIKQPPLYKSFKKVTYLYDHIWYGEQHIDSFAYDKFMLDFKSLDKLIPH